MKDFSRRMISENNLSVNDLIWPIFVCEGNNIADKINSMPQDTRSNDSVINNNFKICPSCSNQTLKVENGCDLCQQCGYSKCDK